MFDKRVYQQRELKAAAELEKQTKKESIKVRMHNFFL